MSSEIIPTKPKTWMAVVAACIIVVILWIGNWIYGIRLEPEKRGSFGDMFGAVNALFSGLAFVGVIYAVILQRHELKIARKDIKFTKLILDEQQRQLMEQNKAAKKQIFEATFFQLLGLISNITNQMEIRGTVNASPTVTHKGKEVFESYLKQFNSIGYLSGLSGEGKSDEVRKSHYKLILQNNNSSLGHYFRSIFSILEFIDKSEVEEKFFYSNLVRSQLSDSEVAILFHHGLSEHGTAEFKRLIEKYSLLQNLRDEDTCDLELKKEYDGRAFGQNASSPL